MTDWPYTGPKMEARASPGRYVANVPRELEAEDFDDEARVYGSRLVEVADEDGSVSFDEVPLTWEDLFDPQEGDQIVHGPKHGEILRHTGSILECLYDVRGLNDVAVYDDVLIEWKTPGVKPACPDISVIPGVKKPKKDEEQPPSFNEAKEGKSPCFVLEVTSKTTAKYDRTSKPNIYRQAGVQEIFLVDDLKSPWEILAQRWDPQINDYVDVVPDRRGRYLAETLEVYFGISPDGYDLVMQDARTGEILLKPVEESRARRQAQQRAEQEAKDRRQAQQRAEQAEERAEQAEQGLRRNVKDLCSLLGIEWSSERSTAVTDMESAELEALWTHLMNQKRWP